MRKIIVAEFVSLDGVMEDPGGAEGYKHGGWTFKYADDEGYKFKGQELWDWVLCGNPIPGMLVADMGEDGQARLREVLDGMLRERAGADGRTVLENAVNIGIGTK